jgi:choline dehydrogenase-like flavoprotein
MLSGIGPQEDLESLGITVVANIPGCGKNMLDHSILTTEYRVDPRIPAHNQIFANPALLADAEAQYARTHTGPVGMYGSSGAVAFPRIEKMYQSTEFQQLDTPTKAHLLEPTRPSAEIWLASGSSAYMGEVHPEESYMTFELLLQNNLSRGTVSLRSKNPRDLPVIDPNFLSHPFDRRIAIESVRAAMLPGETAAYKDVIEEMVHGPSDVSDDDSILECVRANLGQGYHSMGTCKMGRKDDETRVVDADFRVRGMQGLRIADLSVRPILTCNHTQINAYLIGEICAR